MPGHGCGTRCVKIAQPGVISAVVGYVDLRAVWKVGSKWKYDWRAEVCAEVDDRGYRQVFEVLGAECNDFSFGDKEGDFIFGLRCEAAELNAGDHEARGGCQMLDMGARAEVWQGWISVFAMFVMLKGFGQGMLVVGSPAGEVLWILGH